jgi:polar amino acid transport system substrate-binding protein
MQPKIVPITDESLFKRIRTTCLLAGLLVGLWLVMPVVGVRAQGISQPGPQAVPGFWDPRRRPDRPDLSRITAIRFLTETD